MNFILLTGAGFTRNWGGWLASEAFEYLIGHPTLSKQNRHLLFRYKDKGGFEAALSELQTGEQTPGVCNDLENLESTIEDMFNDMNRGLRQQTKLDFEPANEDQIGKSGRISSLLNKFDAIFTLNQDLLLEQYYIDHFVEDIGERKEKGLPGINIETSKPVKPEDRRKERYIFECSPDDSDNFSIPKNVQPYIKLHGSSNWKSSTKQKLMVIGGNKSKEIQKFPILKWYAQLFETYLNNPDTRLMIIGYSFSDRHINSTILNAITQNSLQTYLIDPYGLDVVRQSAASHNHDIIEQTNLVENIWQSTIGASRRSLRETFFDDNSEYHKVMRFFCQ